MSYINFIFMSNFNNHLMLNL